MKRVTLLSSLSAFSLLPLLRRYGNIATLQDKISTSLAQNDSAFVVGFVRLEEVCVGQLIWSVASLHVAL